MKIRDIVAIVAVALAAGSCNQKDDGLQPDDRVPIRLKASVEADASELTRAAGDWGERTTTLTQGTEFLNDRHVLVYIKENDGTHTSNIKWPIEYKVVNDGDGDADDGDLDPVSDTTPFYFPTGVNTIQMHGIHPSYTSGAGFTVMTDQTTEANYAASDLCYSKPTDYSRTGTVDANGRRVLQFKHLLSKIVVNLTVDAVSATGTPDYISLHAKTSTAMTFPADNDDGYTGCSPSDADNPGIIKMKQEAIIPPQTIAAGASFISLTVPGIGPMIYPLPATTTFESGKKYTYNLKVTDVAITADTDITDWNTVPGTYTGVGKVNPKEMNPLYYMAKYNITSTKTDGKWTFAATELTIGDYYLWSTGLSNFGVQSSSYDGWATKQLSVYGSDVTWHLPTHQEMQSIFPVLQSKSIFSETDVPAGEVVEEPSCTFSYSDARTSYAYKSYWSAYSSSTRYAIRFLASPYCSVWKYQFISGTPGKLVVSAKLIGTMSDENTDANKTTLESRLASVMEENDSYWEDNEKKGTIQRTIPAGGYYSDTGTYLQLNEKAYLLTSTYSYTSNGKNYNYWLYAGAGHINVLGAQNPSSSPVRLFRDN